MTRDPAPGSAESGIDRISAVFAACRAEGKAALMPFMVAGFPDLEASASVAETYVRSGADLIEIGMPFSDPLADGPVIHEAATTALERGVTLSDCLEIASGIDPGVPVVLMCYVNLILAQGAERFAGMAESAGVAGVVIPDLPWAESPDITQSLINRGIAPIQLVAPTTTPDRRAEICADAEGFVYLVSTTGTTGERGELPADLEELTAMVKEEARVPVAVGLGIGTVEQAKAVGSIADGVIIGSRLVRPPAETESLEEALAAIEKFLLDAGRVLVPSDAGG